MHKLVRNSLLVERISRVREDIVSFEAIGQDSDHAFHCLGTDFEISNLRFDLRYRYNHIIEDIISYHCTMLFISEQLRQTPR